MRELTKKEQRIVDLAMAGGTDKELSVINAVNELEDKFDATVEEIKKSIPDLPAVLASVRGEKGEKGDRGDDGKTPDGKDILDIVAPELDARIKSKIPVVRDGRDGKDGKDGFTPSKNQLQSLIIPLIPEPRKGDAGKDGKDGKNGKDGKSVNERTVISKIKEDLPQLGVAIRSALERLQGEDRLDISAIKGLNKVLTRVKELEERVPTPAKSYQIRTKDATAQCDGSTTLFTVGGTHFGIMGVFGTEFPQIYRPVIDYTETKTGIQLTSQVSAPASGQTLIIQFLK